MDFVVYVCMYTVYTTAAVLVLTPKASRGTNAETLGIKGKRVGRYEYKHIAISKKVSNGVFLYACMRSIFQPQRDTHAVWCG